MALCNSCGTTGGLSQTCATKSSEITWDGGSLCNGVSGGNINDIVLGLARTVCNLNTEWGSFTITSDDVTLSTLVGSCFTTTTGGDLTTWIDEAESKICALNTNIAALDGTLVIKYDNTVSTADSGGTTNYTNLKTFTIPADTFNENDEYLLIECMITTAYSGTVYGDSKYRITLDGKTILNVVLSNVFEKTPILETRVFAIPVRTSTSTTDGDYHGYTKKTLQNPVPVYGTLTQATSLDFTSSMVLNIDAYNTTGVVGCSLLRVTKFRKSIIF